MKEGEKGLRGKERERKRGKKRKRKRKLRRLLSFFLPLSSADLSPSSPPVVTSRPVQPPPQCQGAGTPTPWGQPCRGPLVAPCPPLEMETKLPRAAAEHPPAPPNPLARLLIPKGSVSPLFFSQPKFSSRSSCCPCGLSPRGEDEPQRFAGF